jgi:hypothetical protein
VCGFYLPPGAELAFWLAFHLGVGAAYFVAAWHAHQRAGLLGLAFLWMGCAAAYGYGSFRCICAQPVTCDVLGPGWHWGYFKALAPGYALVGAIAFGVASAVLLARCRRAPGLALRPRDAAIGSLATLGGWFFGTAARLALSLP